MKRLRAMARRSSLPKRTDRPCAAVYGRVPFDPAPLRSPQDESPQPAGARGKAVRLPMTAKGTKVALLFILFHQRVCGPVAHSLFNRPPEPTFQPATKIEAAYCERKILRAQLQEPKSWLQCTARLWTLSPKRTRLRKRPSKQQPGRRRTALSPAALRSFRKVPEIASGSIGQNVLSASSPAGRKKISSLCREHHNRGMRGGSRRDCDGDGVGDCWRRCDVVAAELSPS